MTKTSKNDCYQDLRRRILVTDLAPGMDLDEVSMAKAYGMSRTPLREVLQRLAGRGYVQIEAHRGAKVASMDVTTMHTFFQTAPMAYANIARLAAENGTAAQLDTLKAAQGQFRHAIQSDDPSSAALHNHRFHAIIGEMAQNPYLMACLDRLLIDHTRLAQTFYRPGAAAETALIRNAADQHDAMIAAFEARDTQAAVDVTLEHWDLSRDRIERFVRPDPLPVDLDALEEPHHAL